MMKPKLILLIILISFWETYSQENKTQIDQDKLKAIQKERNEERKQLDGSTLTELNFEDINGENILLTH